MPDLSQFFYLSNIAEFSPAVIFAILFFFTFASEDLACVAAGALASQGKISLLTAIFACFAGIFVGDILLYWIGRVFGGRIVNTRLFARVVSEKSLAKASDWLETRGIEAIFLSRFVTGLRLPTYLAAGILRTNFAKFTLYFLIAAAVWTPLLVGVSAYSLGAFSSNILLGVVLLFIAVRLVLRFTSWKNRRLFVGRMTRWTHWEFWSLRVFYTPVVVYFLFLAIKHRSLTVFTCVNPAILASGFIGESKDEIYEGLLKSASARPFLLPYILLSANDSTSENLSKSETFIAENQLNFPMIFKPDAGERGKGVVILRDLSELELNLKKLENDYILQEFFDGVEVGVFYFRYPLKETGEIFSITEKRFPRLVGDGISDLETLILLDSRAVALAKKYFEQNSERLNFVPKRGEEVQIINIGTHSRGAIFADGEHLITNELSEAIDKISRSFDGFYFGRFDIRAKSTDDLKRGKYFKIIELNGVTSESTNIYDKKFSLFDAYQILFRQWKIAFEIGAENQRIGFKPTKVFDLIKLVFGKKIEF